MLRVSRNFLENTFYQKKCLKITFFFSLLLPGHRTLYIGVHVPLGRRSHRRHRHHGHRHRKRSKERDSTADDGRESPSYSRCLKHSSKRQLYMDVQYTETIVIFFYLNYFLQQTHQLRECSFSWGQRMAMRSTSPMLCLLSWMKSVSEKVRMQNGKRQPGMLL